MTFHSLSISLSPSLRGFREKLPSEPCRSVGRYLFVYTQTHQRNTKQPTNKAALARIASPTLFTVEKNTPASQQQLRGWQGARLDVCVRACVLLCVCVIFMCAFAKKTCHLLVTDTYMSQCCCVCVCEITCLCPYPYIDLPCFMCLFSAYFILQHSHRILPANKTSDGKLYRSFI